MSERRTNMRISKGSRVSGDCVDDLTRAVQEGSIWTDLVPFYLCNDTKVGLFCHLSSPKLARNESP